MSGTDGPMMHFGRSVTGCADIQCRRARPCEALEALASIDPRPCRVVELRFFAGLTTPETAAALEVSTATVEREWAFAKAWLLRRLSPTE